MSQNVSIVHMTLHLYLRNGINRIGTNTCCVDVSLGCHVRSTQKSAQNREKNVGRRPYEKTTFERRGVLALVQVYRLLSNPTY